MIGMVRITGATLCRPVGILQTLYSFMKRAKWSGERGVNLCEKKEEKHYEVCRMWITG